MMDDTSEHGASAQNPYAAPVASAAIDTATEGVRPTRQELEVFAGKNADRIVSRWVRMRSEERYYAGFCWPAFFLGSVWFLYRKMYLNGAILFGAVVSFGFVQILVEEVTGAPFPQTADRMLNLGVGVVQAAIALPLYYRFAKTKIESLGSAGAVGDDLTDERRQAITELGGTNWLAALGGAAVMLALVVVAVMFGTEY